MATTNGARNLILALAYRAFLRDCTIIVSALFLLSKPTEFLRIYVIDNGSYLGLLEPKTKGV
jgi:hypothetical protein